MRIETERLRLRPWRDCDAGRLFEIAKDPKVLPASCLKPHGSKEESREVIKKILKKPESYVIIVKETGEMIGGVNMAFGEDTYLDLGHADGEIGFWIGSAFWNKGYATEAVNALLERAFTKLRLENVWAGCLVENKRCIRVQDKCGFAFDRVNKNLYWKATDQFISIRIAKLSRERWEFLRRKNGELAR